MTLQELQPLIKQWAGDRGLLRSENLELDSTHPERIDAQLDKVYEEVTELREAIADRYFDDAWKEYEPQQQAEVLDKLDKEVKLELGDVVFTLVLLAEHLDTNIEECLTLAYEKVKNRKGKTINHQFIKE